MATKTSVKAIAAKAVRDDTKQRKQGVPALKAATLDSFVNFQHKLGVGADNPLSSGTYGFNPITRNRTTLEWIHRGSWLGGLAVDVVADDMTRAGIEYITEMDPEHSSKIDKRVTSLGVWHALNETIRWGRLYGGALAVALVDGQDMRTPLRLDTVGPGDFKGLLVLDRWMVEPTTDDLITDFGPSLGMPKYYRVGSNAPALRGAGIHHSRVMVRHDGVTMPYQQRLTENLWGMSVLERLWDRMIAFDSASTGAAQLIYKAYLRTLTIDGLRDLISAGGKPLEGLTAYVDNMRRMQGIEGMTVIDGKDKFEVQNSTAMSGMDSILIQLGQQLSGALQIPLVRLFGQSPSGLNSTGESDLRMYYDHIAQLQARDLLEGVTKVYCMVAASESLPLPPDFSIGMKSLWQLKDDEKQNIAKTNSETIDAVLQAGIISPQTALKELRQASRMTGVFTNITKAMIDEADDQVAPPPSAEGVMPGMPPAMPPADGSAPPAPQGEMNATPGPEGQASPMDASPRRRVTVPGPTPGGGAAGGGADQGPGAQRGAP